MRKVLLIPSIVIAVLAATWSQAYAGDEFEDAFKYELGAIAARATVGLGVGLVHGAVHGAHHHNYGHRHHVAHHRRRHGPHFKRTVVYRPYPAPVRRVERRVVYYAPPPPAYRCCY